MAVTALLEVHDVGACPIRSDIAERAAVAQERRNISRRASYQTTVVCDLPSPLLKRR